MKSFKRIKDKLIGFIDASSWIALVFAFSIDDRNTKLTDVQLFALLGAVIIIWAVVQIITAWHFSVKNEAPKKTADRKKRRQSHIKECEDFQKVYSIAKFYKAYNSYLDNNENRR